MGFGNHYLGRKLWQRSNYENSWTSGKCHWPWWSRKEKDTTFRTFWEIPQISSGVPGASGCRSLRNNSGTSIARSRTLGGSNGAEPPEIFQNLASTDSMEAILYTSYDMYSYMNIYIYMIMVRNLGYQEGGRTAGNDLKPFSGEVDSDSFRVDWQHRYFLKPPISFANWQEKV